MTVVLDLTDAQVDVLREALNYGKRQVQGAAETPPALKLDKLRELDVILRQLPRMAARIDD